MLKLAVDVGFGQVKAMGDSLLNSPKRINFPSIYGSFKPIKFSSGMERLAQSTRLVIEYQDKQYFAGEMALTQKVAMATITKNRAMSEEGLVLLMAGLGLLEPYSPSINLVLGLPMSDYGDQSKTTYQEAVKGQHKIKFLKLDGTREKVTFIDIQAVKVLPQPFGTMFACLLNDMGGLQNSALANSKVGIVDIGFNTLDLCQADNLTLVENRSESYPRLGLYSAADMLANLLNEKFCITYSPEQAAQIINQDNLIIRGRNESIKELREEAIRHTAKMIVSKIKNKWPDYWDLSVVIISGGGGAVIGETLKQELDLGDAAVIAAEPMWKNVEGYYKYAARVWGR